MSSRNTSPKTTTKGALFFVCRRKHLRASPLLQALVQAASGAVVAAAWRKLGGEGVAASITMVVVGCCYSKSWLVWLQKLVVTPMSDLIFEVVLSLSLDGTGATPRWLDPLDLVHGQGAAGDLHNLSRSYTKAVRGSSKISCWVLFIYIYIYI